MATPANRTVSYSVELVDAYQLPPAPSAESCNAMVVQLAALSEVLGLQIPTLGTSAVRPNFTGAVLGDGTAIQLLNVPRTTATPSSLIVGDRLRPQLRAALARPVTDPRAQLQLALVQCAREIKRGESPVPATGAAGVHLAVLVTGVVVAGVVVLYLVQRVSALVESDRVRHSAIAAAAAERASEDDIAVRTGTRPPVGPLQTAAAGAITTAAAAARSDSFGDALREASAGLGTAVKWGVGGLIAYSLLRRL